MTLLNEEICEFIGAFIGDGYFGNYGKRKTQFLVGFAGDKRLDEAYLKDYLLPLIKRNFPYTNPHLRYRTDEETLMLRIYSKQLFDFLITLGFKPGPKTKTVTIPDQIIENKKFLSATIRGLFDTDGSLYFDKRPTYPNHYPRLELHLHNSPLLEIIYMYLCQNGIGAKINSLNSRIQINGEKNINVFLEKIGLSNERHGVKVRKMKAPAEI